MDWQPGDLALCIKAGTETKVGAVYTVRHVNMPGGFALPEDGGGRNDTGFPILRFTCWDPSDSGGCALRFVKVTPDTEDAFDREVIEALKSEPVHVDQLEREVDTCHSEVTNFPSRDSLGRAG